MREVEITQINLSTRKVEHKKDVVAEEVPLHIFVNELRYVTILCSPNQLKELALGHVLSEGLVKSVNDIRELNLDAGGKCQILLKHGIDAEKLISFALAGECGRHF